MARLSLASASQMLKREVSNSKISIVDWNRTPIEGHELLFVIFSYVQQLHDDDLDDPRVYRWQVFIDDKPSGGGIV